MHPEHLLRQHVPRDGSYRSVESANKLNRDWISVSLMVSLEDVVVVDVEERNREEDF